MYEETSLGIYEAEEVTYGLDDSPDSRVEIWGKYLWKHARRQLSFDMWWLVLSLFLICIIEVSTTGTLHLVQRSSQRFDPHDQRTPLMDTSKASWFNIFAISMHTTSLAQDKALTVFYAH